MVRSLRPSALPALVIFVAALICRRPAGAGRKAFNVPLSESRPLTMGGAASDVLVGDAAIADVTVVDHHHLLIHGKAFGRTNLVVMDRRSGQHACSPRR